MTSNEAFADFLAEYAPEPDPAVRTGVIVALVAVGCIYYILWGSVYGKLFRKAGRPFWQGFVPFLNSFRLSQIALDNGFFCLLSLVPNTVNLALKYLLPGNLSIFLRLTISLVPMVYGIWLQYRLAQSFGKRTSFAVGLILLPTIFHLILAFGDAKYREPPAPPEPTEDELREKRVNKILRGLEESERKT